MSKCNSGGCHGISRECCMSQPCIYCDESCGGKPAKTIDDLAKEIGLEWTVNNREKVKALITERDTLKAENFRLTGLIEHAKDIALALKENLFEVRRLKKENAALNLDHNESEKALIDSVNKLADERDALKTVVDGARDYVRTKSVEHMIALQGLVNAYDKSKEEKKW